MALERIKALVRGSLDIKRLEKNGFVHGKNLNTQHGVIIDPGHCWLIECGDNVTLAPYVHILAHDASTKIPLGYTKIGKVTIGDNIVVGSMSLVSRDLHSGGVYAGNPCMKIMDYSEFTEKHRNKMKESPVFDDSYIIGEITDEKRIEMKKMLEKGIGYIV